MIRHKIMNENYYCFKIFPRGSEVVALSPMKVTVIAGVVKDIIQKLNLWFAGENSS